MTFESVDSRVVAKMPLSCVPGKTFKTHECSHSKPFLST